MFDNFLVNAGVVLAPLTLWRLVIKSTNSDLALDSSRCRLHVSSLPSWRREFHHEAANAHLCPWFAGSPALAQARGIHKSASHSARCLEGGKDLAEIAQLAGSVRFALELKLPRVRSGRDNMSL